MYTSNNFQSRHYCNGDVKADPRPSLISYNTPNQSPYVGNDSHHTLDSLYIRGPYSHLSPKGDNADWNVKTGNHNRSMPNGQRIDKQAYLNKVENGNRNEQYPLHRHNTTTYDNSSKRESADHIVKKNTS
jgi:hypothetical protein